MKQLTFPCALALLLLTAPLAAQSVGGVWEERFATSGEVNYDRYGASVSGAGDVNNDGHPDYIVGAPDADPNGLVDAGSVFVRSGADDSVLYRFDGEAAGDRLGASVVGPGDANRDGFPDILAGAPHRENAGMAEAGAAYLLSGIDGSLLHRWQGQRAYDHLGASVGWADDTDRDGYFDLLLGAPDADPLSVRDAGSAYLVHGATGAILHRFDGAAAGDRLGFAVSGADDIDRDGFPDILIGAPGALAEAGAVYLYDGPTAALAGSFFGQQAGDHFGASLAALGDIDRDGYPDILVGAPHASPNGVPGAGSATAFATVSWFGWRGEVIHHWDGSVQHEKLGWAVAGPGDVNGDFWPDLLIGATGAAGSKGRVGLYSGQDGYRLAKFVGSKPVDRAGIALGKVGSWNRWGFVDLLIGNVAGVSADGKGRVERHTFNPAIAAQVTSLGPGFGVLVEIDLDFPDAAAGLPYRILASETGIGPHRVGELLIPLTADPLFYRMAAGDMNSSGMAGASGRLNAQGDARATFRALPTLLLGQVKSSYYTAAVVSRPWQLNEPFLSSVAVELPVLR